MSFGRADNTITGSDLMLVDFGRSIDLVDACSQAKTARSATTKGDANEHPLNVQFHGDIPVDDEAYMRMRHGQTWGYELDMYGICASSHVLLFGEHIQIEQDIQSKHYHWKLKRPFRRYWQQSTWTRFFDTLLNIKDADENMSSRLLKSLKKEFEQYLQDSKHQAELRTLLTAQAGVLPKQRLLNICKG
jgi:checkpoint serine/threonine-protein kinase